MVDTSTNFIKKKSHEPVEKGIFFVRYYNMSAVVQLIQDWHEKNRLFME